MGTARTLRAPSGHDRRDGPPPGTMVLRGDLDAAAASEVVAALERLGPRSRVEMILDLSEVGFADVGGIEVLVRARGRLVAEGGELRTIGAPAAVDRLLAICGLGELHATREAPIPGDEHVRHAAHAG